MPIGRGCLAARPSKLLRKVEKPDLVAAILVELHPLPAGLASADGRKTLEFSAGNLAAGQSRSFTDKVKADKAGKFENTATAMGDGNITATSNAISTTVRQPALKILKTGPADAYAGQTIAYEITVTNIGDVETRQCIVEDTLPAGCTLVNASDAGKSAAGRVTWDLGTLAVGATKKLTMTIQPSTMGKVKNTAAARGYCADPVTASCETDVRGLPALLLEVVDLTDPVKVGGETVFEITVTNQGTAMDHNIRVTGTLDDSMGFVSCGGATPGKNLGQVIGFDELPTLAPKEKAVWRVTAKAMKPEDARFKLSMRSDHLTKTVDETEATQIYQ